MSKLSACLVSPEPPPSLQAAAFSCVLTGSFLCARASLVSLVRPHFFSEGHQLCWIRTHLQGSVFNLITSLNMSKYSHILIYWGSGLQH